MFSFYPGVYFQLLIKAKRLFFCLFFSDLLSGVLWQTPPAQRPVFVKGQRERAFFTVHRVTALPQTHQRKLLFVRALLWCFSLKTQIPLCQSGLYLSFFFSIAYFESSHWKEKRGPNRNEAKHAHKLALHLFIAEKIKAQFMPTVITSTLMLLLMYNI